MAKAKKKATKKKAVKRKRKPRKKVEKQPDIKKNRKLQLRDRKH